MATSRSPQVTSPCHTKLSLENKRACLNTGPSTNQDWEGTNQQQKKCKCKFKGVRSLESEARDKVLDNNPDRTGFGNGGFSGEGKTGAPREKPLGARKRTNNKLNPHMTPCPGIEPWTHEATQSKTSRAKLHKIVSNTHVKGDQPLANSKSPT